MRKRYCYREPNRCSPKMILIPSSSKQKTFRKFRQQHDIELKHIQIGFQQKEIKHARRIEVNIIMKEYDYDYAIK